MLFSKNSFGQTNSVFGQNNSSNNPFSPKPFGSSGFGQKPAFGGFGSTPTPTQLGDEGAPAYGATSTPAFGATSAPAFGTTRTFSFRSTLTPAFGSTGSAFGSSTSAFGANSSTPAFGSSTSSPFSSSIFDNTQPSQLFSSPAPTIAQPGSTFGQNPFPFGQTNPLKENISLRLSPTPTCFSEIVAPRSRMTPSFKAIDRKALELREKESPIDVLGEKFETFIILNDYDYGKLYS